MSENTPGTTSEVAPPSTRVPDTLELSDQDTPQFKLSAEGQALRAQLDKQAGKPTPPKELKVEKLTPEEQRAREAGQRLTETAEQ